LILHPTPSLTKREIDGAHHPAAMTDHDPEFDAVVEELQRAGIVTIGTDAEGEETWTLTPTGEQIALLEALLERGRCCGAAGGRWAVRPLTR
jgi:hypothetical protein